MTPQEGLRRVVDAVGQGGRALLRVRTALPFSREPEPLTATGLVADWAQGKGPKSYQIGPETHFAREFARSPNMRWHVRRAMADWSARDRGEPGGRYDAYGGIKDGSSYGGKEGYAATFGIPEFYASAIAGNAPAHVIGSATLRGARRGARIEWTAENVMGLQSFQGQRYRDKFGLKSATAAPDGQRFANKSHTIHFSTNLEGRPIDVHRQAR